jgi:hypothetical protein
LPKAEKFDFERDRQSPEFRLMVLERLAMRYYAHEHSVIEKELADELKAANDGTRAAG